MIRVLESEGVEYETEAIESVIDLSKGHVRDILNKLETLAQVGSINQEAVAEKFNLNASGDFFRLLLSLSSPGESIALLDSLCDKMGPVDVVAGLSEAAINSYRVANKLPFGGPGSDIPLAEQLYGLVGDKVLDLANYFLNLPYVTRNHLTCDILRLSNLSKLNVAGASQPTHNAPVVFSASPVVSPSVTRTQPPQPVAVKSPVVPPATKVNTDQSNIRLDGVGPLGTDPRALTSVEPAAIPRSMPRDTRRNAKPKANVSIVTHEIVLTPTEFGSKFLQLMDDR
jgi:hypothetical protein